jgi:hypothetical protein
MYLQGYYKRTGRPSYTIPFETTDLTRPKLGLDLHHRYMCNQCAKFQITPTQSRYPLSVADGRNVAAPRPAFTVGDAGKN